MKHKLIIDFDLGTLGETSGIIIKDIRCPYEDKLEIIKKLTEPFIEWGGPLNKNYRVRMHKHPELQEYVSELMKILYPDEPTSEGSP